MDFGKLVCMKEVINTLCLLSSCFIRTVKKTSNITLQEKLTNPVPGLALTMREESQKQPSVIFPLED